MRVLVLGDVMLDRWEVVEPTRISSESPVMICTAQKIVDTPGGAGNVAMNCAHLGSEVTIIGRVGYDSHGDFLDAYFSVNKVRPLLYHERETTVKHRFVDSLGRHILRVDYDHVGLIGFDLAQLMSRLERISDDEAPDVVMVSDYGKGVCHPDILVNLRKFFPEQFIIVNGKPKWLPIYNDFADALVFNRVEALEATGCTASDRIEDVCSILSGMTKIPHVVVTAGAEGLCWKVRSQHNVNRTFAPKVETADVAGAGDTICATIANAGKINSYVLQYAVENAAIVVSQRGTSVPEIK